MVRNENNCDEPGKVVQLLSVDKDESRIALPKHLFSARESRKMRRSRLPRILITTFVIGLLFTIRPLRAEVHNTLESCVAPFGHDSDDPVVSVTAEFIVSPISGSNHLSITAKIAPRWHIYSNTQSPGGPLPTRIEVFPFETVRLVGSFHANPPPDRRLEPAFDNLTVETHHNQVTWRAPIDVAPGVDAASVQIKGVVHVQPCNPNNCLPPQEIPFTAVFAGTGTAPNKAPMAMKAPQRTQQQHAGQEAAVKAVLDPTSIQVTADAELKQTSLVVAMILGFFGGLILNLMPCVLPVIGLKVLSFLEQAGHSRRQALMLNLWYSLGLVSVFLILASLAAFVGLGWGQLFSFAGFNITLAAVVFAMGLSFLGVWEIPIPGFVGSGKVNDFSRQEGAMGAFLKGVLTTVLATPCSGPFLASALAWSVGQPPAKTYAVFVSVGVGMASPYLLIGAFPELLRFLPKPGAWMETFKQAMGFVLLGTVAYLLTLLEWVYVVPTVTFLFGLWAACWWIGRTPLTSAAGQKARAWLSAAAFACGVWFVTYGWLTDVMAERFERTLQSARGALVKQVADEGNQQVQWRPFSREALDVLIAAQETVLVDFTADWCMTCKTLEKFVLNTAETCDALRRNGVVTLRADWTHASAEVTEMLTMLGSKQVPVLAVFPAGNANHPIVLRGGYTQETLLEALERAVPSKPTNVAGLQTAQERK